MKRYDTTTRFDKQFAKLAPVVKAQFLKRINLFFVNPTMPMLHDHALSGDYRGYRSINVTGDVRALYYREGDTVVIFAFIGTHSQLYGK